MDREQLLLAKLAEECIEVGKLALKSQLFGLTEHQFLDGPSNAERLHAELNHLIAAIEMLNEECNLAFIENYEAKLSKKEKVNHYAEYSKILGRLQ